MGDLGPFSRFFAVSKIENFLKFLGGMIKYVVWYIPRHFLAHLGDFFLIKNGPFTLTTELLT